MAETEEAGEKNEEKEEKEDREGVLGEMKRALDVKTRSAHADDADEVMEADIDDGARIINESCFVIEDVAHVVRLMRMVRCLLQMVVVSK